MTFRPGPKTFWGLCPSTRAQPQMSSRNRDTLGQSRHRTSDGKAVTFSPRLILFLIVAVVLLYGVIYPNLHVVLQSLQREGSWSLQNYREILAQRIVHGHLLERFDFSFDSCVLRGHRNSTCLSF